MTTPQMRGILSLIACGSSSATRIVEPFVLQAQALEASSEKELSLHLWEAGLEATLASHNEQRFSEVLTAYEMMSALWSDDLSVTELRQRLVHW